VHTNSHMCLSVLCAHQQSYVPVCALCTLTVICACLCSVHTNSHMCLSLLCAHQQSYVPVCALCTGTDRCACLCSEHTNSHVCLSELCAHPHSDVPVCALCTPPVICACLCSVHTNSHMCLSVLCAHQHNLQCVISGFRREVDENCALQDYYVARNDISLPTFRNNLSLPSSKGARGCLESSVRNCHCALCNNPEERSFEQRLQGIK
jgi:hypothetical protein